MQGAILVIQTAFLGDIVLATGFLRTLRTRHPKARILFLTSPVGKEVLEPNPWNIELIAYDKHGAESGREAFWEKVKFLRAQGIETAYCLHRYWRSSLLARLSGARKVYGFREAAGAILYSKRVSRAKYLGEAEKNLALLGNFSPENTYPELFFSDADRAHGEELLRELRGEPFLAIAPSSVWSTKRWPIDRFAKVALWAWRKHGLRTVALGAHSNLDQNLAGQLVHFFVHEQGGLKQLEGIPINLGGRTSLGTMKYILSKAKAVLTNDSAPLHIATAVGSPVVAVFGPTTRELGFFPVSRPQMSAVAEIDLHCRPCGKHGHDRCPEAHFRCMLELAPSSVQMKLDAFLCQ